MDLTITDPQTLQAATLLRSFGREEESCTGDSFILVDLADDRSINVINTKKQTPPDMALLLDSHLPLTSFIFF